MHSLVRGNLLNWHGSFVKKKQKKVGRVTSLRLFWAILKERNGKAFEWLNGQIKQSKSFFICNFLD